MFDRSVIRATIIRDPVAEADRVKRLRRGRIVMRDGQLVGIEPRWLGGGASVAQVWWHARYGRTPGDECRLDFHVPRGLPRFLTLDFLRSGLGTRYRTFVGACHVLDAIAQLRGTDAIVAHVSNRAISDRLLIRLGWSRHLHDWRGRHWIRRFYGEYPASQLHRYLGPRSMDVRSRDNAGDDRSRHEPPPLAAELCLDGSSTAGG